MIAGYIGCAACNTRIYRIDAEEVKPYTGHFLNVLKPLGHQRPIVNANDHLVCPGCGGALQRFDKNGETDEDVEHASSVQRAGQDVERSGGRASGLCADELSDRSQG